MINDWQMTISKDDFLRIVNKGFEKLSWISYDYLVQDGDHITDVRYSRSAKTYTLICKSGREIRIEVARKKKAAKVAQTGTT